MPLDFEGWQNELRSIIRKGEERKTKMKFIRPKVGIQVVRVERIRSLAGGKATEEEIDKEMTRIAEEGLPEPLSVVWNTYDWPLGYVDYKGSFATVQAIRALGHQLIEADVQIDPASGLQVEVKENHLQVVRE